MGRVTYLHHYVSAESELGRGCRHSPRRIAATNAVVRRLDDWPHARHVRLPIIQAVKSSEMDLVRSPRRIRLFLFHVVPRHGLWNYRPDQGPPGSQVEKGQSQLEVESYMQAIADWTTRCDSQYYHRHGT